MGNQTGIGWTDKTWNPWYHCRKVSPGCANCYMFTKREALGYDPNVVTRSKTTFRDPLKWKDPAAIFTCSWSDFFIEEADAWRPEAWEIIRQTPRHVYQILTKRIERVLEHLPWVAEGTPPWPHVWLGVSVENQRYADERIPLLLQAPAALRFLSCEPLLGPIDLRDVLSSEPVPIDWVIVGGQSGENYRHHVMDLAWLDQIVADCQDALVPVFVKQDSHARSSQQGRIPDDLWKIKQTPFNTCRVIVDKHPIVSDVGPDEPLARFEEL